ncbi:sensor histidine kinase [Flavihumibacter fluvii]|uniref:sensor histidine kinase n=1 Tax=Flavihumibacter fluvii TaxID=2838157 RepID=UPI001BDF117C|nr:sensor histidine kinase [Flavihumibacter fluvii]ULQ53167.1 histidine kinase [Flavihumibacter fluvii]
MKPWYTPTKLQRYAFYSAVPVVDILINYILFDDRLFREIKIWIISVPLVFFLGWVTWRTQTLSGNFIRFKLPQLKQTFRRISILSVCSIPVMAFSLYLVFYLYANFRILEYRFNNEDILLGVGFLSGISIIFETLFEADFILNKYKESVQERKQMEHLSMLTEFEILKNQVNPHFLFNCFNTLSSLIGEDKRRAEQFLDELSKVYRYLLRNNEDGLSTLENEIKFIQSYFLLLKTRYGESVQMNTDIDKKYSGYLLPSLSLQLLVENAVKHNILSKTNPLLIDILTTAGNQLVVNNNMQRRAVKAPGNKIGLENIRAKYQLLNREGFQVMEDEHNYTVVLPLIWNNQEGPRSIFLNELKTI